MTTECEYVTAMRKRYQATSSKRERGELLDELESVVGNDRKHAITVMNQKPTRTRTKHKKRPRPTPRLEHFYTPTLGLAWEALVWEALDYCCAEGRHPQLAPLSDSPTRHEEARLTLEVRAEPSNISRATLTRRLRELPREKPRLVISGQHPSRLMKSQMPVDRYHWNATRPGTLEIDLVEHGSRPGKGHHACALSVVDVAIGWSRHKAVMGKSQAVASIEHHRSRPYEKHENAHVAQNCRQLVREVVGYERYDTAKTPPERLRTAEVPRPDQIQKPIERQQAISSLELRPQLDRRQARKPQPNQLPQAAASPTQSTERF